MYEAYKSLIGRYVPELSITSFDYLGEGEDNLAFEVNGELVFRFAKQDRRALQREAAILRFVQGVSPLPVPVLTYEYTYDYVGQGFVGYRKLPGTPLIKLPDRLEAGQWPGFAAQLADFMAAMNSAEVESIKKYLRVDPKDLEARRDESAEFFAKIEQTVHQAYHGSIREFLASPPPRGDFIPVFAHNDLGIEHILVDPVERRITGIIDWGDTAMADPAGDFGRIYRDLGPEVFHAVLNAYALKVDKGIEERAAFYARCGLLEDLAYGTQHQKKEYIDKCLAALSWLFKG